MVTQETGIEFLNRFAVSSLSIFELQAILLKTIAEHQVSIVQGSTGSGKTTQLPKFCLALGDESSKCIVQTQPRRLAAKAVASRLAKELGSQLGGLVGYKVRFSQKLSSRTRIKIVTDGILLAEIRQDPLLSRYRTIIVDEAHERSLNIDFLLGYLKEILPKRTDLKLIITSATLETKRFSSYFNHAPVVEIPSRLYPVETRYRPLETNFESTSDECESRLGHLVEAVHELCREGRGDILIFCSGEKEIREMGEGLQTYQTIDAEVLPLYARLNEVEQQKIFMPSRQGKRRIILATNVAETSITVPGIRYVIDMGLVRISRYNHRTKVQRLPIEPISQASAIQRQGRCGRNEAGICIRLYSKADYESRPKYTDPEILRTNLASVILQMSALGLKNIAEFPFIEAPSTKSINSASQLLSVLGAIEIKSNNQKGSQTYHLTQLGKQMAFLPLDPQYSRILLEAKRTQLLYPAIVVVSALTIGDPRETTYVHKALARERQQLFRHPNSSFLEFLKLWNALQAFRTNHTRKELQQYCQYYFLSHQRIREWHALVEELLEQIPHSPDIKKASEVCNTIDLATLPIDKLHRVLLSGFLLQIGWRLPEGDEYRTPDGAKFKPIVTINAKKQKRKSLPQWIMAGELVQTGRLWGNFLAPISVKWVEELASAHLKKKYSDPYWNEIKGAAYINEQVTFHQLVLIAGRPIFLHKTDPKTARKMFIENVLIANNWPRETQYSFLDHNRKIIKHFEAVENKLRKPISIVSDSALYDFFNSILPEDIYSVMLFDAWYLKAQTSDPKILYLSKQCLEAHNPKLPALFKQAQSYPERISIKSWQFRLTYQFNPQDEIEDGITIRIPVPLVSQMTDLDFSWHIEPFRKEVIHALLRGLPKAFRRQLQPMHYYANALYERICITEAESTAGTDLFTRLQQAISQMLGLTIPFSTWKAIRLPSPFAFRFAAEAEDGSIIAKADSIQALKQKLALKTPSLDEPFSTTASALKKFDGSNPKPEDLIMEKNDLGTEEMCTDWIFSKSLAPITYQYGQNSILAYPTLYDEKHAVRLSISFSTQERDYYTYPALARLLLLNATPIQKKQYLQLTKELTQYKPLFWMNLSGGYRQWSDLTEDLALSSLLAVVRQKSIPLNREHFDALRIAVDMTRSAALAQAFQQVTNILHWIPEVMSAVNRLKRCMSVQEQLNDVQEQWKELFGERWILYGFNQLSSYPRYLQALIHRMKKLPEEANKDRIYLGTLRDVQTQIKAAQPSSPSWKLYGTVWEEFPWMLQELRISLFAQPIKTAYTVSKERILRKLQQAKRLDLDCV